MFIMIITSYLCYCVVDKFICAWNLISLNFYIYYILMSLLNIIAIFQTQKEIMDRRRKVGSWSI